MTLKFSNKKGNLLMHTFACDFGNRCIRGRSGDIRGAEHCISFQMELISFSWTDDFSIQTNLPKDLRIFLLQKFHWDSNIVCSTN